jgi:hypothetical protein
LYSNELTLEYRAYYHNGHKNQKGSETLSKQANQRYRKEKEKEHLKKAGLGSSITGSVQNHHDLDKINTEYDTPGNQPHS